MNTMTKAYQLSRQFDDEYDLWDELEGEDSFLEFEEDEWIGETNRSSRDYIRWIQRSLNKILSLRLKIDGIMGPKTRSAVRSFQQKNGLTVDGIVGPKTEASLKVALGSVKPKKNSGGWDFWPITKFAFTKASLQPNHYPEIQTIAAMIKSREGTPQKVRYIDIVGHTDPVGTDQRNYILGCKRAWSVTGELRRVLGETLAKRIVIRVVSMGENDPVRRLDGSIDNEESRRVEVSCYLTTPPPLPKKSAPCDHKMPSGSKGYLTVEVTRSDSGQGMLGIQVNYQRILNGSVGATWVAGETDSNGQKDLGPLDPGRYKITVNCPPHPASNTTRIITIRPGKNPPLNFSCVPNPLPQIDKCHFNWEERFRRHYDECVKRDQFQESLLCNSLILNPHTYMYCNKPPHKWPNNPKLRKLLNACCPQFHQKRVDQCVTINVREELNRECPRTIPQFGLDSLIQREYRKWKQKHGKPQ